MNRLGFSCVFVPILFFAIVSPRLSSRSHGATRQAQSKPSGPEATAESPIRFTYQPTSCGYASSSAGPVHFGLGSSPSADLVEIHWPSGTLQTLHDVIGDRVVMVKEPAQ
jgi:hypothetical protein